MAAAGVDSLLAALSVKIAGDTADFEKALARTKGQLKDFGKAINTDLTRSFETFDATARKLEKGIGRVGESMVNAGATMTKAVTAPLALVGFQAVKTAAEFEQMADVLQAQSQASAKDMELVAAKARELGADIKLPGTSAKDALLAISELSKGGLTLAQSMEAARGTIQLSTAAQIDNAQAAIIQANALNAFGLAASEATNVSDLLAGAANQSSASITQVAEGFQAGAAVARMANLSIAEFTTGLALMANAGIKGSDAGTSIKSMLMALQSPSDKAARKLSEIGISIFDAQGKMKPFTQVIADFSTRLKGLNDQQKADILGTIFGSDGIRAAQIIFKEGPEGFAKLQAGITRSGSAAELAAAQNKGFLGAIDSIISAGETFLEGAAKPFLGALTRMAQGVAEFVGFLDSMPAGVKTTIVVVAGLAAAIGPLILAVGAFVSIIPTLTAGLATIGTAFTAATGPIGLIVAAIAGAAILIISNWDSIVSYFQSGPGSEVWNSLVALTTKVFTEVKAIVETAIAFVVDVFNRFAPIVSAVFSAAFSQVGTIISTALDVVRGVVTVFTGLLKGDFSEMWEGIKLIFTSAVNGLIGIVTNVITGTIGLFKGFLEGLGVGEELQKMLSGASDTVTAFADSIKLGSEETKKSVAGLGNELAKVKKQASEPVKIAPLEIPTASFNAVPGGSEQNKALAKYKQELQSLLDQQKLFGDSFNFAGEKAELLEKSLVSLMESGFKPQSEFIQGLKKELDELNSSFSKNQALFGSVSPVQSNVERVTAAPTGDPALPQIAGEGLDRLPQALDMALERMKLIREAGEELGEFLQGQLSNAFVGLGQIMGTALMSGDKGLQVGLQGLLNLLADFAVNFGQKMIAIGIAMNAAIPGSGVSRMIGGALLVAAGTAAKAIKIGGSRGIPAMAEGGIVTSATLALIGEAGKEAVIPLDRLDEFMNGGGSQVEVVGRMELTNKAVAFMIENAKNEGRRLG